MVHIYELHYRITQGKDIEVPFGSCLGLADHLRPFALPDLCGRDFPSSLAVSFPCLFLAVLFQDARHIPIPALCCIRRRQSVCPFDSDDSTVGEVGITSLLPEVKQPCEKKYL